MLVRPYYTVVRLPWAWGSDGLLRSQLGLSLAFYLASQTKDIVQVEEVGEGVQEEHLMW